MSLTTLFEKFKTNMFGKYSHGLGNMLLITGTLGWILSAAGQLCGIATNDKISKDQKKFLIPQEMADAVINIASFYFVTKGIKNLSKNFVSSGKLITKEISKVCQDNKIVIEKGTDIGKAISTRISDLKATLKIAEEKGLSINKSKKADIENSIQELQKFSDDKYAPFEGGAETLGSIVGAVLSSNIITPIIRNPIAAYKQKQSIALEKMQNQENKDKQTEVTNIPVTPVIPMQNKISFDNYRAKTPPTTGGAMKI